MLAAICIPRFTEGTASRLQALRARYDPKYAELVPPHVTLVFPTDALAEAPFVAHVVSCSRGAESCRVGFSSAREFTEERAGTHLVYLPASSGAELFLRLHEKMYSGPLTARSRPAGQYIPHITLGRFSSAHAAAIVSAEINETLRPITGEVGAVDIVYVGENLVRHIHTEPLRTG